MENIHEILGAIPLFEGISREEIPLVIQNLGAYTQNYQKGEFIRLSGDPADFIGIVLAGAIQILRDDYHGNRTITASFGKGSIFAETFSCAGVTNLPVDIFAVENATIMIICSNNLFNFCGTKCRFHDILMTNLLKIVARKNILLSKKLQYISCKTTSEKIMAYLNDQAILNQASEFTIPFNRQELADYLGVERSAMSAEIGKLVRQGVIKTHRSKFQLV